MYANALRPRGAMDSALQGIEHLEDEAGAGRDRDRERDRDQERAESLAKLLTSGTN
jgi:hypothetical protein